MSDSAVSNSREYEFGYTTIAMNWHFDGNETMEDILAKRIAHDMEEETMLNRESLACFAPRPEV